MMGESYTVHTRMVAILPCTSVGLYQCLSVRFRPQSIDVWCIGKFGYCHSKILRYRRWGTGGSRNGLVCKVRAAISQSNSPCKDCNSPKKKMTNVHFYMISVTVRKKRAQPPDSDYPSAPYGDRLCHLNDQISTPSAQTEYKSIAYQY